jgi:Na+-transporting methylmalonyl-CoA/oxaloacetate decarboxylase gamma subunit
MINSNILISLKLTLVGMSLVFAAILLLWLMIVILMRITTERPVKKSDQTVQADEIDQKKKAAIAAVVVALARESETELHEFPLPPTAIVSAWQAVMRSEMLKKRGRIR